MTRAKHRFVVADGYARLTASATTTWTGRRGVLVTLADSETSPELSIELTTAQTADLAAALTAMGES